MLAVGWIESDGIEPGVTLQVQILLESFCATVVADPVYDPENELLTG